MKFINNRRRLPVFLIKQHYIEFLKIFDSSYYRLGRVGRLRLNNRLNLRLNERLQILTYQDIFAIIDKLIHLTISKTVQDDIDHLKKFIVFEKLRNRDKSMVPYDSLPR